MRVKASAESLAQTLSLIDDLTDELTRGQKALNAEQSKGCKQLNLRQQQLKTSIRSTKKG